LSIEKVKKFWNSRPCNINHSKETIGTCSFFDQVEQKRYFVEPHIPQFAEFNKWKNKSVLEIGCGIGTDTIIFARAGANITAIDISERSIQISQERAKVYGLSDKIDFIQGSAEEMDSLLEIKPQFDLIYSFGVIHHTPNPENIIKWFQFLLEKNGIIKIMLYHRYSWKVLKILIKYGKLRFWKLNQIIARHSEAQTGCPVTHVYSKKQARKMLEKHSLSVRNIDIRHIFPYRIPEYIQNQYIKNWYFKIMPKVLFNWLQTRIGWHLLVTGQLR